MCIFSSAPVRMTPYSEMPFQMATVRLTVLCQLGRLSDANPGLQAKSFVFFILSILFTKIGSEICQKFITYSLRKIQTRKSKLASQIFLDVQTIQKRNVQYFQRTYNYCTYVWQSSVILSYYEGECPHGLIFSDNIRN